MKDICYNNWFIQFLIDPKYRIFRHLLIFVYIMATFYDSREPKEYFGEYHYYHKLMWIAYVLIIVYVNMYLLVPKLLFREKYFTYLFSLVVMIGLSYLALKAVREHYFEAYRITKEVKRFSSLFRELLSVTNLLTLIVFASTSIKLFQRWSVDNIRINELEKNSLQMELKELKNQINPHFLFNMLNNVNVLVKRDPEKASLVILKLSDFLRYQLYDNNQHAVLLAAEIQFLKDFMDLETIRRDGFEHEINMVNGSGSKDILSRLIVPPNLFTTFIENAIKHSFDAEHPSKVTVEFKIGAKELVFRCVNTKPEEMLVSEKSGLGLVNIKRRLELLYGNSFQLGIVDSDTSYTIHLTLPL